MRVYVGTYNKYNEGSIAGKWLDLKQFTEIKDFYKKCSEIHKDEHDPEFMFQDYENIPSSLVGESWISETVFNINKYVTDLNVEAFMEYLSYIGSIDDQDFKEVVDRFQNAYYGEWNTFREFTEHMFDECELPNIPEEYHNYISYDYVHNTLKHSYYFSNGHVFLTDC